MRTPSMFAFSIACGLLVAGLVACGPSARPNGGIDAKPPCVGLECRVEECPAGTSTTISGTVYAPNGTLPLYNVAVYVPNAPLGALPVGVSCDRCGTTLSGSPVVKTLSDYRGEFTLSGAPSGINVPLVLQLGKWRREVLVPNVVPCQDNKLTDPNLTRLPKKQSEGNMPRVAVTLGSCDQISCMLPKVGIDPSEFGGQGQNKAVTFFQVPGTEGPPGSTDATAFWNSTAAMANYDMIIVSCECWEADSTKNATSFAAMTQYLAMGGRIFTTDFQYTWYKFSPDPMLASIGSIPGGAPEGGSPIVIDTSFPKGKALADWMDHTNSSPAYGQVTPDTVFDNVWTIDPAKVQVFASSGPPTHPRYMTINTPVGVPLEQQCGKAVHLDAHINSLDSIDSTFPAGCTNPISSGEASFAFFFFDLASCIQDDSQPPIL